LKTKAMEKENEQDSQSSHRIQFGHDRSNKVLLISLHHSRTLDNYSVRVLVPQVSRLELGLMSAISRPSESEMNYPQLLWCNTSKLPLESLLQTV
jgi:hypothetical protein